MQGYGFRLPTQLLQGIKYYVDGAALDLNENWWLGYEQTLPATATVVTAG